MSFRTFYRATLNAFRYEVNGRVTCPRVVQELVTAWRVLRRGNRR
jgi:hypothetical protein